MRHDRSLDREPGRQSEAASLDAQSLAPGKRSLSEGLVVQRREAAGPGRTAGEAAAAPGVHVERGGAAPRAMLQMLFGVQRAATTEPTGDSTQVHAAAARGTATPATRLPFADQIQRAFGRHDISGIQAHLGGDATASARTMGARAYATGDHVVLGDGADLHTVAHEAAHVVQQRGGVQLQGGVGQAGDAHERHADAVADAVVRGASAEALLDQHANAGSGTGASSAAGPGHVQLKLIPADAMELFRYYESYYRHTVPFVKWAPHHRTLVEGHDSLLLAQVAMDKLMAGFGVAKRLGLPAIETVPQQDGGSTSSKGSTSSEGSGSDDDEDPGEALWIKTVKAHENQAFDGLITCGKVLSKGNKSSNEHNGEKAVYVCAEHPSFVIAVQTHYMSNSVSMREEYKDLKFLKDLGFPVVEVVAFGSFQGCPAIVMRRYRTSSKRINNAKNSKRDGWRETAEKHCTPASIGQLQNIQKLMKTHGVVIGDLQFLIDDEGNFLINDPNGVWKLKGTQKKPKGRGSATTDLVGEQKNNVNVFTFLQEALQDAELKPRERDDSSSDEDKHKDVERTELVDTVELTLTIHSHQGSSSHAYENEQLEKQLLAIEKIDGARAFRTAFAELRSHNKAELKKLFDNPQIQKRYPRCFARWEEI